jgi:catechol 2,3-dioxygenase
VPSFTPSAVGGVVLRSGNLFVQEAFYGDALGFATVQDEGAVRVLNHEGETLIRLEEVEGAAPPPHGHTGLFHTALRFPTREELGASLRRLLQAGVRLSGASDHGVSEALYLNDPERNGVELYWDRRFEEWPRESDGSLAMFTAPLDVAAVLRAGEAASAAPARGDVGHVHLKVADVPRSVDFYSGVLGLNVQASWGEAGFLAVGEYHHHVGANTWESRGAPPAPPTAAGLERFELRLPDPDAAAERARAAGRPVQDGEAGPVVLDPDGIGVVLRP